MLSLSDNNQADVIEAFNSTSRYLDDSPYIDYPYFEQMVGQIYPTELQLNKANSSDTAMHACIYVHNTVRLFPCFIYQLYVQRAIW